MYTGSSEIFYQTEDAGQQRTLIPVQHFSPSPDELVSRTTWPITSQPPLQNGDVPLQMQPSPNNCTMN